MRFRAAPLLQSWLAFAFALGCKSRAPLEEQTGGLRATEPRVTGAPSLGTESASPARSELVALAKARQAARLRVPPRREHRPTLAFAGERFAQLTDNAVRLFNAHDFSVLTTEPLDAPRTVLALADGSILALGGNQLLHWQPDGKRAKALSRPVLFPGAEVFADAQRADRLWVFDPGSRQGGPARPTLSRFELRPAEGAVLLPEQTIELGAPGGVLGTTREGVWLYLSPGRIERFAPGGLRLSGLIVEGVQLPTWVLPTRRLDQSVWLSEEGQASRVLVSPDFRHLTATSLAHRVVAADAGDDGRLLALVAVTGEGPRFELLLMDAGLSPVAQVSLPVDEPTGADDWVQVVMRNQAVAVAPHQALVAVGGPSRVSIYSAPGQLLFSIPSK